MARYVIPYVVTIPPGTPIATPLEQALSLDFWSIEAIGMEVPPGPNGLMGFQIYNNGVPWIPYGSIDWFVWDNHAETYNLTDQPNASGWAVVGYNLGTYPHSVTTRWHVNPPPPPSPIVTPPQVTFVTTTAADLEPVTIGAT